MELEIHKVGVIGAGQMGNGIAHVCALAGFSVLLNDVSADRINSSLATINGNGSTIQRDTATGTPDFRLFYVSGGLSGLYFQGVSEAFVVGPSGHVMFRRCSSVPQGPQRLRVARHKVTHHNSHGAVAK